MTDDAYSRGHRAVRSRNRPGGPSVSPGLKSKPSSGARDADWQPGGKHYHGSAEQAGHAAEALESGRSEASVRGTVKTGGDPRG